MASLIQQGDRFRIDLTLYGKRVYLRLGAVSERAASRIVGHVQDIADAMNTGGPVPAASIDWIRAIDPRLRGKLARYGLVPESLAIGDVTVAQLCAEVFASMQVKPQTQVAYSHTRRALETRLGARRVATITRADALEFAKHLREGADLATATANRRVRVAKMIFNEAIARGYLAASPFAGVKGGGSRNPDRMKYVDVATVEAVIAQTADVQWRALIALGRFAALRVQSEALPLTLDCIDWAKNSLYVESPKTGTGRHVPITPELAPYLLAAYDAVPEGESRLFTPGRFESGNLRTHMLRLIRRAGLVPWPKPWHALRASRVSEWADRFPAGVVSRWTGHSPRILNDHYVVSIDGDENFRLATVESVRAGSEAQKPAQKTRIGDGCHAAATDDSDPGSGRSQPSEMTRVGVDCQPLPKNGRKLSTGRGWIRTSVGVKPTGLQPVTIGHSVTRP